MLDMTRKKTSCYTDPSKQNCKTALIERPPGSAHAGPAQENGLAAPED